MGQEERAKNKSINRELVALKRMFHLALQKNGRTACREAEVPDELGHEF